MRRPDAHAAQAAAIAAAQRKRQAVEAIQALPANERAEVLALFAPKKVKGGAKRG